MIRVVVVIVTGNKSFLKIIKHVACLNMYWLNDPLLLFKTTMTHKSAEKENENIIKIKNYRLRSFNNKVKNI